MRYAENPGMPLRRIEIYLAQIALCVSRGTLHGAENMTLMNFMLEREVDSLDVDQDDIVSVARGAFGYAPQGGG